MVIALPRLPPDSSWCLIAQFSEVLIQGGTIHHDDRALAGPCFGSSLATHGTWNDEADRGDADNYRSQRRRGKKRYRARIYCKDSCRIALS